MSIVPQNKPKLTQAEAESLISGFSLSNYPVRLLGIRGYYKKTMGNPVKNDRGIYDDAIFILTPELFATFNANTDPSVTRKGIAVLKAGNVYIYRIGQHAIGRPTQHEALRQYGNVTVIRDQQGEFTDKPSARFWINIHRGGWNTTSSLGCQTVYPAQWGSFIATIKDQLKRFGQKDIPYILLEQQ